MNYATNTLKSAQRAAVKAHKGEAITEMERGRINFWVDKIGPENFYMDGELFASHY